MESKRSAMKEQLQKRLNEQQQGKNKGLNDYESYFQPPEGVSIWNTKATKEGTDYGFDIIPFFAGPNYPTNGYNINEGDLAYVLDVWTHFKVGPLKKPVVCPLKNYGKSCPLCEKRIDLQAERGQMDKAEYKKFQAEFVELFPKRRVIYNVIVRSDDKEEAKGVQVYEQSHFFVEKKLQEAAKKPRGGGLIPYPDPDEGKTIWINFKENGDSWDVSAPIFEDRKYAISDDEIEAAVTLDEIITVYEYDDIKEMMSVSSVKTNKEVSEEVPGAEKEEEKPVVSRRSLKTEQVKTSDGTVDKSTGEVIVSSCPLQGGQFGIEHNDYNECDTCSVFDDCAAEKEKLEKIKKEAEAVAAPPTPTRRRKLAQ